VTYVCTYRKERGKERERKKGKEREKEKGAKILFFPSLFHNSLSLSVCAVGHRAYLNQAWAWLGVARLPPNHRLHPAVLDFLVSRHDSGRERAQRCEEQEERERERVKGFRRDTQQMEK
jgi:hypothetical protein